MPAGVYVIWCKKTKKAYIGESRNIYSRIGHHKTTLRHGCHSSRAMQLDWDTYGPEAFQFRTIEEAATRQEREEIEEGWIKRFDSCNSENGYNISPSGTARGLTHTAENKKLMSIAAKERNARPEYKKLISERCKRQHVEGTLNITAETRTKVGSKLKGRPMPEAQKQKLRETALANREQRKASAKASVAARRKMVEEDPTAKERLYGGNKGKTKLYKARTGTGRPRNKFTPKAKQGSADFKRLKG